MSPRPRRRRRKQPTYKRGTPDATVRAWLDAWRRRDFTAMVMHCQGTWIRVNRQYVRSPSGWLVEAFGSKELMRAQVGAVQQTGAVATVDVTVTYRGRPSGVPIIRRLPGRVVRRRLRIRVICEALPYQPSTAGVWGVNPLSALNERPI